MRDWKRFGASNSDATSHFPSETRVDVLTLAQTEH